MKAFVLALTIFLLITPMYAQTQTTGESPTNLVEYIVTADTANLRSGPGTSHDIVGTVQAGESLLIYSEPSEVDGWLKVYIDGSDAYIADFLLERAPQRYYPVSQEPVIVLAGRGTNITDVIDIPEGAYRIDASINDNFFILRAIVVAGDCRDSIIINEGVTDRRSLNVSALFVSRGCSIIFETDNVDGTWEFAIRDVLDPEVIIESAIRIETGTTIYGNNRQVTMPTLIEEGIWSITARVDDNFFILRAEPIGDCDAGSVFNEGDFDASSLEVSAIYRAEGECVVFWETSNVDADWEITFERIR